VSDRSENYIVGITIDKTNTGKFQLPLASLHLSPRLETVENGVG